MEWIKTEYFLCGVQGIDKVPSFPSIGGLKKKKKNPLCNRPEGEMLTRITRKRLNRSF